VQQPVDCTLFTVLALRSYLESHTLQPDVQALNKAGRDNYSWIGQRLRPACLKPARQLDARRNAL